MISLRRPGRAALAHLAPARLCPIRTSQQFDEAHIVALAGLPTGAPDRFGGLIDAVSENEQILTARAKAVQAGRIGFHQVAGGVGDEDILAGSDGSFHG